VAVQRNGCGSSPHRSKRARGPESRPRGASPRGQGRDLRVSSTQRCRQRQLSIVHSGTWQRRRCRHYGRRRQRAAGSQALPQPDQRRVRRLCMRQPYRRARETPIRLAGNHGRRTERRGHLGESSRAGHDCDASLRPRWVRGRGASREAQVDITARSSADKRHCKRRAMRGACGWRVIVSAADPALRGQPRAGHRSGSVGRRAR
jgi:hypothetical protein